MKTIFISPIKLVSLLIIIVITMATDQVSAGVFNLVPNDNDLQTNLRDHCLIALNPVFTDDQLNFHKTSFVSISSDFQFKSGEVYWLKLTLQCTASMVPDYWSN